MLLITPAGPAAAQFVKGIGGTGNDVGFGVTYDGAGNVYVVGSFASADVDFDPENSVSGDTKSTSGSSDIFLAKYNSSGVLQFVKAIGGAGGETDYSVATDGTGNVYVTGSFASSSVDFDPENSVSGDTKSTSGSSDIFLAKYNSSGVLQFVKAIGGTGSDVAYSVTVDDLDNVYVTGSFASSSVDFDPENSVSGDTKSTSGSSDIFLAKYNGSGVLQFVKAIGGANFDLGNSVAVDGPGNVYVTGLFAGNSIDFDPENTVAGDTRSSSGGTTDLFLAKYSSSGVLEFVKVVGGAGGDRGFALAVGSSNDVYVTGAFASSNVDFDPENSVSGDTKSTSGGDDIFLAKYNSSGVLQFVKAVGGTATDRGLGLAVNDTGNIYVTGSFASAGVDFDPENSVSGDTKSTSGGDDIFLALYDGSGVLQLVRAIGGTATDRGRGLAIGGPDAIYLTGSFASASVDFDPDNEVAGDTKSTNGGDDIFLALLTSNGVLPVELVSFTAVRDGSDALLRWETASETNNAGFQVEQMQGGGWRALAFIAGRGTTSEAQQYEYRAAGLTPGTHVFRLRQVDYEGTFAYSPEVELAVGVPGTYLLSEVYPNPFNPRTSFTLAVRSEQRVLITVHDVLGRQVSLLYDGQISGGEAQRFTFEDIGLPSGTYLLRVVGETFREVRKLVLAK